MRSEEQVWKFIWKINLRFAGACVTGGIAWICWQITSADWYGFGLLAVVMVLNAIALVITGIVETVGLILSRRRLARFRKLGGDPREDVLASVQDLKARGMTR